MVANHPGSRDADIHRALFVAELAVNAGAGLPLPVNGLLQLEL